MPVPAPVAAPAAARRPATASNPHPAPARTWPNRRPVNRCRPDRPAIARTPGAARNLPPGRTGWPACRPEKIRLHTPSTCGAGFAPARATWRIRPNDRPQTNALPMPPPPRLKARPAAPPSAKISRPGPRSGAFPAARPPASPSACHAHPAV